MTICAYDAKAYFGGPIVWAERLAYALRDHEVDVRFLFFTQNPPGECPTLLRLRRAGFSCASRRWHTLTQRGDNTEGRTRWLLSELAKAPPDVFVANLVVPALYAAKWVRAAGIPTIGVWHSDDDFYEAVGRRFVWGDKAYRLNAVVCVSELLREIVCRRAPNKTVVRRISCGTPVPPWRVSQFDGTMRIVYVGRFVEPQKRISLVTEALCRAVREVPGTEAVMFGDGPARAEVSAIIGRWGAEADVRLGGVIPHARIQEELRHAHAIVFLSDSEGLPIALLEAMACGVVPVCLRIRSGIPEVVLDRITGMLTDDRGVDFVNAIRELREQPTLWSRLSVGAREMIINAYSTGQVTTQWLELIDELRAGSRQHGPIRIPARIQLPASDPQLRDDNRRVSRGSYLKEQASRFLRHAAMIRNGRARGRPH